MESSAALNNHAQKNRAIRISLEMGLELQGEIPGIAELFINGLSYSRIAKRFRIASRIEDRFGIPVNRMSRSLIAMSVSHALWGHQGGFQIDSYDGLIPASLRRNLYEQHRRDNGYRTLEKRVGIFGRTRQQNQEAGKLGGKISGASNIKNRTGIGKMTPEELKDAGIESAIARGLTPWVESHITRRNYYLSELEYAHNLTFNPDYRRGTKVNNALIAGALNKEFHGGLNIRDAASVKSALIRYREKYGPAKPY